MAIVCKGVLWSPSPKKKIVTICIVFRSGRSKSQYKKFKNLGMSRTALKPAGIDVFLNADSDTPHITQGKNVFLEVIGKKMLWSRDTR